MIQGVDYAKSIKDRAKLVDNKFRQDMNSVFARDTNMWKKRVNSDGTSPQLETFATGHCLNSRGQSGILNAQIVCFICSGQHEVWNKCLEKGHIAKHCPKVNFKCQHSECGGGHH